MKYALGFIGAGNMAEAIVRGILNTGLLRPEQIAFADKSPARCDVFASLGLAGLEDSEQVVQQCQAVVLAVKPQNLDAIGEDLKLAGAQSLLISIMAGVGSAKIAQHAGDGARIIRVMPNTPMLVGMGMSAVCKGVNATDEDLNFAQSLFKSAGECVVVGEEQMDGITAVSGSGPAYVFYLAEAMETAASRMGLGIEAEQLVRQTIAGAAKLLAESPDDAATLRNKVTSPGGTTEAATNHMDAQFMKQIVIDAMLAARDRSKVLGG